MKQNSTSQEILFLTNSLFAQKELSEKSFSEDNDPGASHLDKLEEACWNGLLKDWLAGAIKNDRKGQRLFLWKVRVANRFLCAELSPKPVCFSGIYSLNPYLFLPLKNNN